MTLEQHVRQLLRIHGLKLDKNLGQHFLIDETVLDDIVNAAEIQEGDEIVEIGPGIGILTQALMKRGANVTAIELDERFLALLRSMKKVDNSTGNLTVIHGNALQVSMPSTPYTIVANIPYHITSPLLRHVFLESQTKPRALTLLIQREVAERICDEEDRGILSVIVQLFGAPRIVRHVPPSCFLPPPEVDSSVLRIESHASPLADAETIERILTLVKIGFSQKRKKLRNTIGMLDGGHEKLARANVSEDRRPQTLTISEWIALAQA